VVNLMGTAIMTTPLGDLESVCADLFDRWDRDMRAGKLLTALQGQVPGYDPRVDRIRRALADASKCADDTREADEYDAAHRH
jgi:hypothetical protein